MSLFIVGSFVGTIALSLTAPPLSSWVGWRAAYAIYALAGIAAAIAFRVYATETRSIRAGAAVGLEDTLHVLGHRIVWACNALQFIRFALCTAFNFWLPSLLLSDRGFPLERVGAVVALSAACAAAANPLGGYVSDRFRNPPLVIGTSLTAVACTSALLVSVHSTWALLVVVALHSIFMTVYFGPLFAVPVEALGQRTAGLATGIGNLFANLGALIAAYTLGIVKDTTGSFAAGFYGMAVLAAIGVLIAFWLARLRNRALAPGRAPHAYAHV
jgi:nitrate/nitrite transporter NarK